MKNVTRQNDKSAASHVTGWLENVQRWGYTDIDRHQACLSEAGDKHDEQSLLVRHGVYTSLSRMSVKCVAALMRTRSTTSDQLSDDASHE